MFVLYEYYMNDDKTILAVSADKDKLIEWGKLKVRKRSGDGTIEYTMQYTHGYSSICYIDEVALIQ